jgi:hypothetical protein
MVCLVKVAEVAAMVPVLLTRREAAEAVRVAVAAALEGKEEAAAGRALRSLSMIRP